MANNMLLCDPNVQPTAEIIAEGLGAANNSFVKFVNELKRYDITLMDWRYYNDSKAWLSKGEYKWTTPRGTAKIKPVFWLSIWDGFFRTGFFFSADIRDDLLSLPISQEAKDIIASAKPMGKTARFLPVALDIKSDAQLRDAYVISEFRKARVK